MATLIAKADIRDELVNPAVTPADLTYADTYIDEKVCKPLGKAIADIPATIPFQVKALMIAQICYEVCKRKAGGSPNSFNGQNNSDAWATKMKIFRDEMNSLENGMTANILTGASAPIPGATTIVIGRR